jgi:peptide/nickel transport system permease protein
MSTKATSPGTLVLHRFTRHHLAVVSGLILIVLGVLVLAAPLFEIWISSNVDTINLLNRFGPPSLNHPLGTDELGRDVLIRLLYGGRVSLLVGLTAALSASLIGIVIGLAAGYFGGIYDKILMRLTDGAISLPLLPLLIVLAAIDPAKLGFNADNEGSMGLYRIVFIVALVGWTTVARLVRSTTLTLKHRPFVLAAHAQGARPLHIMTSHILPNLASPIIVATTLSAGNVILLESVLSFLGLGIQPPMPSWGNLLTNAQELIWNAPSLAFYPGALIFITVIALNFIGDGLQDALDPRAVRR